ncbi:MAG: galactose-1-phosphate uridylyltransferase [Armatimonadetes bacterium]|nr:galactose-1-phosphate uridylyltransferase [Armatimonadota bacterium]MDE2206106.1 galactose-1-phosphate uridylyltransferase [Armatimonadota bacterium]
MSELRWHPLLQEWVITATHRQERTFLPPKDYDPLAPTAPGGVPTEIPAPDYEIVVFENRFPSLRESPPEPAVCGSVLAPVRPADGACEVICYTPDYDAEFATLPVTRIRELVEVWAHRFHELGNRPGVRYVYIFENKGKEIGVTLQHPHGQIYAYPFVPPTPARELASARDYFQQTGGDLLGDLLKQELEDGRRIVTQNEHFAAVVPFYARYPYELHITPTAPRSAITEFTPAERAALAAILKEATLRLNLLWNRSMPYIMLMHQRPTDGESTPWYRFHVEIYPPYRTPRKLKYLAGSEAGAGAFINDTLPETTAAELRAVQPDA